MKRIVGLLRVGAIYEMREQGSTCLKRIIPGRSNKGSNLGQFPGVRKPVLIGIPARGSEIHAGDRTAINDLVGKIGAVPGRISDDEKHALSGERSQGIDGRDDFFELKCEQIVVAV